MVARWWRSAALVVLLAGTPAQAHAYEMWFTGSGSRFPGESCTFDSTVTISASGSVATGHHAGTYRFDFQGTTRTCGATETGGGNLFGDLNGGVSYNRTGSHLKLFGHVSLRGTTVTFNATCGYVPTSVNPSVSFSVFCFATDATT